MTEQYAVWKALLAGQDVEIHEDEPHEGRWRIRAGKDRWVPVATWWGGIKDEAGNPKEDETLHCLVGFSGGSEQRDPLEEFNPHSSNPMSIWLLCAKNPVTQGEYEEAYNTGRWYDDAPDARAATMGDNLPDDPLEQLRMELEGEAETAKEFLAKPVEDQKTADMVGPWAKRVADITKRADALRKEEKQPHLDASRFVDDKWRDVIEDSKVLANALKTHLTPWLKEQKRAAEEAARKAAELEAKAAAAKDEDKAELEEQARELERDAAQPTYAGRTGSKVKLSTRKVAKIVDYDACLTALKDRDEIKEVVQSLANRAVKSNVDLPGVEVVEEEKAVL